MSPLAMRCLPVRWWEHEYDESKAKSLLSAAIGLYKERFAAVEEYKNNDLKAPYDEVMYG